MQRVATSIDDPRSGAGPSRRRIVRLLGYLAITGLVGANSLHGVGVAELVWFAEAHQVVSGQLSELAVEVASRAVGSMPRPSGPNHCAGSCASPRASTID